MSGGVTGGAAAPMKGNNDLEVSRINSSSLIVDLDLVTRSQRKYCKHRGLV